MKHHPSTRSGRQPGIPRLGRLAAATLLLAAAAAHAQTSVAFDIPAQPLDKALAALARQSGARIIFSTELTESRRAPAVQGSLAPREALARLLAGSGLALRETGAGAFTVVTEPAAPAQPAATVAPQQGAALSEVQVTAAVERSAVSEGTGSYAARGASVFKGAQSLREIPQSVTVLTRQQMDDQNMATLSDALKQTTGVVLYGNYNGASSFYVRNNTLEAQYDGVPGFSSLANSQFDMAMYDRVEVLRGPAGLLQGSGNPSGSVNIVRKRPLDHFAVSGGLTLGSWHRKRADIDLSAPLNAEGSLRARGVLVGEDRDFFYDRAGQNHQLAYGIVELDITPVTTVGASLAFQKADLSSFSGLPAYGDGGFLGLPRKTNLDAPWTTYERDTREAVLDFSHRFANDWTLKASARTRRDDSDYLQGIPRGTVNRATGLGAFVMSRGAYAYENTGADIHLEGRFDALGRRHDFLVGYNHDAYRQVGGGSSATLNNIDIQNPANYYDPARVPAIAATTGTRTTQSGLYGMGRFKVLDPLTVIVGGRFTDYQNETRTVTPTPSGWTDAGKARARGEFTPYLGAVLEATREISVYASYADIFIPQTAMDFSGNVLAPRVGGQVEVGIKGEFFDKRLNASLAAFRIRDRNRAITDPNPAHVGPPCGTTPNANCSVAAGLVQVQGIEAEVSGRLLPSLELVLGYTHLQGRFLSDSVAANVGQPFSPWQPRNQLKAWGTYRVNSAWTIGAGLTAQNAAYSTGYPTSGIAGVRQAGYAVASLQVGWRIDKRLSASLTVNNLFDRNYYYQINDSRSYNYYGDPRNVVLALRGTF